MTLLDVIAEQDWCISVNKTNIVNKAMITMMKPNLEKVCNWPDQRLPELYTQHITDKMDITTLCKLVPCRLDDLIMMTASTAYATQLKTHTIC